MSERPQRPKRKRKLLPDTDDFVRASRSGVGAVQNYIVLVGTAILGGDFRGNARGQGAIGIATTRNDGVNGNTEVASGYYSVAIGAINTVNGDYGVRVGYNGSAQGESAVSIGNGASADGTSATAIGIQSAASGPDSVAIGGADIRTQSALGIGNTAKLVNAEYVFNTGVAPVIKRAFGLAAPGNWPKHLGGALTVYMSGLLDLKTATFYTLDLPAGVHFLPLSMGLIVTGWNNCTVQPFIKFGVTFSDGKYVASRQTTQFTAAGKREHYLPESLADWETDPNFTVVTGATATTLTARAYWVGILLEDE